jgi:hypothetical protein
VLKDIYDHINDQNQHLVMDARKFDDWIFLYLRRAFSFLINLIAIFTTGSIVYYLEQDTVKEDYNDYFKDIEIFGNHYHVEVFAYFIPAMV